MNNPKTSQECLAAAFQATLRGDTAERDRLCERGEKLHQAERLSAAVEKVLSVNFYVTRGGVAIPSRAMGKAAGVLQ